MSDVVGWIALMIQFFGIGWECAALVGGLSTGLWAVGLAIWFAGLILWIGANL